MSKYRSWSRLLALPHIIFSLSLAMLFAFQLATCFSYTTPSSAEPAFTAAPSISRLCSLADELRKSGQTSLAECADDQAWNLEVKVSVATTSESQDALVMSLWNLVSDAYLAPQSVKLWTGIGGPPAEEVALSLDAPYTAAKAGLLINAVLTNNYTEALLPVQIAAGSGGPTHAVIPFDDPSAVRARSWLDKIGVSSGFNINGFQTVDGVTKTGLEQPAGAIVYIGACQPLLGSELASISNSPAANQPCLLSADEIETLARALLNRNIFVSDAPSTDGSQAFKLLTFLKANYPNYVRMSQVDAMIAFARPKPPV